MTTQWIPSPANHAARTDVGVARDHNEDRYLASPPLFVVADGLGGHAAGEVAAQMLVDHLGRLGADASGPDLVRAIEEADRAINAASKQLAGQRGMSTTCVAILLGDGAGQVSHVGDSRAYRLRDGGLSRLTEDHSVVAELVRGGIISEADAETDDRRHMLTQALGSDHQAAVTTTPLVVQSGDRYLLCSDGLSGQVTDAAIEAVLSEHGDPGLAADELVRRANAAGGVDNVTVVIVDAQVSEEAAAAVVARATAGTTGPTAAPARRSRAGAAALLVLLAIAILAAATIFANANRSGSQESQSVSPSFPSGSAAPSGPVPSSSAPPAASAPPDGSAPPAGSAPPGGSAPPAASAPNPSGVDVAPPPAGSATSGSALAARP